MDVIVIVAIPLAVFTVWLCDQNVWELHALQQRQGVLARTREGDIRAEITEEGFRGRIRSLGQPYGDFVLHIQERRRGWPITTSFESQRASLDLNLFDEQNVRIDDKTPSDSPIGAAIESALRDAGEETIIDAWRTNGGVAHTFWLGWIVSIAAWWIMLLFASYLLIQTLRFASFAFRRRRQKRAARLQARNRCPNCGYDLRGLEFSERCPECGALCE